MSKVLYVDGVYTFTKNRPQKFSCRDSNSGSLMTIGVNFDFKVRYANHCITGEGESSHLRAHHCGIPTGYVAPNMRDMVSVLEALQLEMKLALCQHTAHTQPRLKLLLVQEFTPIDRYISHARHNAGGF